MGGTAATVALATLMIACSDASALARPPAHEAPGAQPLVIGDGIDAGTEAEGLALGRRNGEIIVSRLRDRTVGTHGCRAIGQLESALVQVARNVRRPAGSDDLVRGFYRGYMAAVREGIRDARSGCGIWQHASGAFAGSLYGAILCEVSKVSLDVATSIELDWLYDGWSGGSTEVIQECRTTATVTLRECDGDVAELLSLSVERSCSDASW